MSHKVLVKTTTHLINTSTGIDPMKRNFLKILTIILLEDLYL